MDFTIPLAYYTEWWNINSHRCNHINKPPVNQESYGFGRSFVADWARVGAVSINHISDTLEINSQMSKKLAGKIHYFHPPIPLLPTYYSSSGLQHNSNLMNNEDVESEQQQENQQPQKTVDSSTVHDYGFEHLLNDHILGEQASAAFLCGKLQGLLRCNTSKLMQIDHHNNNSTTTATTDSSNDIDTNIVGSNCNDVSRLIQQLFTKAEKGLNNCHSIDEQNKVIKEIQDLIISGIKTDISTPLSSSVDIVNGMINDSYTSASTVNTNDNGNRLSSKRRRLTKKLSTIPTTVNVDDSEKKEQLLPATIRKLLYPTCYSSSPSLSLVHESNDSFSEPDNSRLLASFDPFVIRLASRIINPDYLGNGLLSNVRSDYYHFSANHSCHSDMILWTSPQSQSLSIGRISSLLKTTGARESERFFTLTLPSTNLSSRSFCELDSCFIDESGERISIIGRLLPTSNSKKSVVYMQMKVKDVSDLSSSSIEHIQIIPGSSKHCVTTKTAIASVCMSRSIPGEWCMAGNYFDKKGDRKAAIYLYNCSDSKLPIWSGYVNLGNYTEAIAKENAMCLQSTASSSSSWPKKDPVQLDIESYCQYSTRKLRLFQHHSNHYWLRVGFGSYPGELCLTTTRRILVFDTRAPLSPSSNAYQLLNIAEKSSQFNSTDYITYCSPKWMGDVYILAGGYYSMFLLDKRMPNRTVLHWSHNLTKPLAHLHWTKVESRYQSMYNDIPQFLVSMTSQYASDMSTFGMNFNSASGPQYVGPCLSGMPLTSLVTSFPPSNTFQSSSQNALFKTRLQSSVCGITSYYYPLPTDDGKNQFHTLLLTSYGDLFDYCAYLTGPNDNHDNIHQHNMIEDYEANAQTVVTNWLSELCCRPQDNKPCQENNNTQVSVNPQGSLNLSKVIDEELSSTDLDSELADFENISSKSNGNQHFSIHHLNLSTCSTDSSKYLLKDLEAIWNYDEAYKEENKSKNSSQFASIFLDDLSDERMLEEEKRQKMINESHGDEFNHLLDKLKNRYMNSFPTHSYEVNGGNVDNRWPCALSPSPVPGPSFSSLPSQDKLPSSSGQSEYFTAEEFC